MNPIAMSVGVSPELPEMYPLEGPVFDFGQLMSYPMAPFQYALGAPSGGSPRFGIAGGDISPPSIDLQKPKYPYIIKVSTFSVGPLPFGNGNNNLPHQHTLSTVTINPPHQYTPYQPTISNHILLIHSLETHPYNQPSSRLTFSIHPLTLLQASFTVSSSLLRTPILPN